MTIKTATQENIKLTEVNFQVNGQEAEIIDSTCTEHGIRVLKFSKPHGPVFHYEEATNTTFGDQPHLRDPLDKKYVYLKNSTSFDTAGEGTYATRDIPAGIAYVLYGGYLYDKEQKQILKQRNLEIAKENKWMKDHPELEASWKYK